MSWRAWLIFGALCLIWGLPYFLIKVALEDLSPLVIAWGRITLAAVVLAPLAQRRGVLRQALEHKGAVIAFALAELVLPFSFISIGEQWISSSLAGILIATAPLTIVFIAPLFGVRERLTLRRLLGLLLGFGGVIAILGFDAADAPVHWLGVGCVLIAAAGYAIGPLIVERRLAGVDELGAVAASLVIASVVLLPFAVAFRPTSLPPASALACVIVLGLLCTAIAMLLFFQLIHDAGAARAALIAYVNPGVAALLGVSLLGEHFGVSTAAGLTLILLGSWLASQKRRQPDELRGAVIPLSCEHRTTEN